MTDNKNREYFKKDYFNIRITKLILLYHVRQKIDIYMQQEKVAEAIKLY